MALKMKPDVVIMDINMPDIDGITATTQIRDKDPAIQVIILSVQNDPDYMNRAMFAGVRGFLPKPPNIDELTKSIQKAGLIAHEERTKVQFPTSTLPNGGMTGSLFLGDKAKIISIYGAKGGVGRSSVASNLAVAFAQKEKNVFVG